MSDLKYDQRGATLFEFSIVLPLCLAFLIVSFDLLRVSFNALTVQFVATRVIRQASTGALSSANIENQIINLAGGGGVRLTRSDFSLCSIDSYPCSSVTLGNPNETIVLSINIPVRGLMFGPRPWQLSASQFNLSTSVLGRMEPN